VINMRTAFGVQLSAQVGVTMHYPHTCRFIFTNYGGSRLNAQQC
jgi:hypothetical protein